MTPRAFDLLYQLVRQSGEVVSKEALLEAVWGADTFVESSVLTQNIYTVRRVLGQHVEGGANWIETFPRRGYRFNRTVTSSEHTAPTKDGHSIVALPFQPLGHVDDSDMIGLAFADALTTRLSASRRLQVRPIGATVPFEGADRKDPAAIGDQLGVDFVVDGTVQQSDQRIRINVRLVDCSRATYLWADSFDFDRSDPLRAQYQLAQTVGDRLRAKLFPNEQQKQSGQPTSDLGAYRAFMKGRFFWNKRSAEGINHAIGYFREATALDPQFAAAFAGLADCHVLRPFYANEQPSDAFPEAITAATRALELDPLLPEAHTALAYARFLFDWDWYEAEAGFTKAIELNQSYATAHHWYAYLLAASLQFEEAREHIRMASDLDPLSPVIAADVGFIQFFSRQADDAETSYRHALELDSYFGYAHFGLSLLQAWRGRLDEAVDHARRAVEFSNAQDSAHAALGYSLALSGEHEAAEGILEDLRQRGAAAAGNQALVLVALGRLDDASVAFKVAFDERSRFVAVSKAWALFDPLRERPDFQRLQERVGRGMDLAPAR